MKTNFLASAAMAAVLCSTLLQAAHAANSTISFTGQIGDETCTIEGGLGNVARPLLGVQGDAPQGKNFAIHLTGCDVGIGVIHTQFEINSTTDMNTGWLSLKQEANVATNVQIQWLNADQFVINLAGGDNLQNSERVNVNAGAATRPHISRYYATGRGATVGHTNSLVRYTLRYN